MKKFFVAMMTMAMMAVMIPLSATEVSAQTYRRPRAERTYEQPKEGNIYKRHRNLINIGIGAGAGAIIGGLIGGKKGAAWGALAGGGAGAAYTYKINPKTKRYERVYYR